ncbi:hypothetical protein G9A89_020002 [Geosiphon pyriformis]|nr:hypothetical protein G9A89_020002 [Geosiphon pyriformis]
MSEEELILREKLVAEERTLKRILKKYSTWKFHLSSGEKDKVQKYYDEYLIELSSYEVYLMRFQLIHEMNAKENQNWIDEKKRIEEEIEVTKREILQLQQDLSVEQHQVTYKIEYDQIARSIQQHISRDELEEDIKNLDEEIAELERKEQERDAILARRRNQIQSILSTVAHVQEQIREEHFQEERSTMATVGSTNSSFVVQSEIPSPSASPNLITNGINGYEEIDHTPDEIDGELAEIILSPIIEGSSVPREISPVHDEMSPSNRETPPTHQETSPSIHEEEVSNERDSSENHLLEEGEAVMEDVEPIIEDGEHEEIEHLDLASEREQSHDSENESGSPQEPENEPIRDLTSPQEANVVTPSEGDIVNTTENGSPLPTNILEFNEDPISQEIFDDERDGLEENPGDCEFVVEPYDEEEPLEEGEQVDNRDDQQEEGNREQLDVDDPELIEEFEEASGIKRTRDENDDGDENHSYSSGSPLKRSHVEEEDEVEEGEEVEDGMVI